MNKESIDKINISKTFVVADIHGVFKALEQVLERSGFDNSKDRLICLGDYVDGYSGSVEVVDLLIKLQEESNGRHVFLAGNHDLLLQLWLTEGREELVWVMNGGLTTQKSYVESGKLTDSNHKEFFKNLQYYYEDGNRRAFVHAGFDSENGLGYDTQHEYVWSRDFWNNCLNQSSMKSRVYDEIYIGHTPTINYMIKPHYLEYKDDRQEKNGVITVPMFRKGVYNLDTGCGWGRKLTMMNVETKEYFQSDNSFELYPEEKGR